MEDRCGYVAAIDSIVRGTCCGHLLASRAVPTRACKTHVVTLGATDIAGWEDNYGDILAGIHRENRWYEENQSKYRVLGQKCCAPCYKLFDKSVYDVVPRLVRPFAK